MSSGDPNVCYRCGKEGHYDRQCPNPPNYGNVPVSTKNPVPKAYVIQAKLEGPSISQGWLEALEPEAKIVSYTKRDVEVGTSNFVIGQLSVANLNLHVLFDSGATHSFISTIHTNRIDSAKEVITRTFRTSLPSGDVLISTHWL